MDDRVLLFHGIGNSTCGSCASGRKKMAKRYGRVPVKRRRRSRGMRGVNGIGNVRGLGASASVKETIGAVKGIVMSGAIAGAGAFVTGKVWDMIAVTVTDAIGTKESGATVKSLGADTLTLAKMATGIAIGLVISKLLKKPVIGVAFATGAVAVGVKDLMFRMLASEEEKKAEIDRIKLDLSGIPQIRQSGEFQRAIAASNFQGVPAIGPGIPNWMDVPQEANFTYAN